MHLHHLNCCWLLSQGQTFHAKDRSMVNQRRNHQKAVKTVCPNCKEVFSDSSMCYLHRLSVYKDVQPTIG